VLHDLGVLDDYNNLILLYSALVVTTACLPNFILTDYEEIDLYFQRCLLNFVFILRGCCNIKIF
jgi:hypothetical protein